MPLEEQRRFYDRVRGLPCKAVIEDAQQLMSSYRRDEHFYEEEGQFLPLAVWGARGFCIGSDFQRFRTAEDGYIEETMDLIIEAEDAHLSGNMGITQFRKICTCSGYKVNRKGIQADASLRGHLRLVETTAQ